eukprot:641439-Alexandrium_andersonii.AAC.1
MAILKTGITTTKIVLGKASDLNESDSLESLISGWSAALATKGQAVASPTKVGGGGALDSSSQADFSSLGRRPPCRGFVDLLSVGELHAKIATMYEALDKEGIDAIAESLKKHKTALAELNTSVRQNILDLRKAFAAAKTNAEALAKKRAASPAVARATRPRVAAG